MILPNSVLRHKIEQDIEHKLYNPLNDVLFKFIFGSEERKQVTISFLNAVLNRA